MLVESMTTIEVQRALVFAERKALFHACELNWYQNEASRLREWLFDKLAAVGRPLERLDGVQGTLTGPVDGP